ncbi:MAG: ABC transporter permease subunit [Ignavibacteriaceae bacterium]
MKKIGLIILFTLREAFAKKVFIFFLAITALVLIITVASYIVIDADSLREIAKQQGEKSFNEMLSILLLMIVAPLSALCLLLAIFASAGFIPSLLEKGTIDLFLSKPITRSQLLWGKYFGGIAVVFLNIFLLVLGVWLIIALKFSYWDFSFLLIILLITFTFAVLYSLIVLFSVITKSSVPGMMIAYFIFLILSPLLALVNGKLGVLIENDFARATIKIIYYIVPNTSELMGNLLNDVAAGKGVTDFQPVITSFLFLVLVMSLADYIFRKKDF